MNNNNCDESHQNKHYMNADDISRYLGLSRSCVYALMHDRDFPALRIGKRLLVSCRDFEAWIEKQKQNHSENGGL